MLRPSSLRAFVALPLLAFVVGACSRNEEARREAGAGQAAGQAAGSAAGGTRGAVARADAARIMGDSTAPLWVVVVSDFQCPYCKMWEDQTAAVVTQEYVRTGRVRMAFVNLPLSMHPNARPAAEAAMCAGAQGKFWPVHDAIFATQTRWAPLPDAKPVFDSLAVANGVEPGAFRSCVSKGTMRAIVDADAERASSAGVRSTPTFLISHQAQPNARPVAIEGAAPADNFRAVLDSLLRAPAAAQRGTGG